MNMATNICSYVCVCVCVQYIETRRIESKVQVYRLNERVKHSLTYGTAHGMYADVHVVFITITGDAI